MKISNDYIINIKKDYNINIKLIEFNLFNF
jgi:hypothetical protein